MGNAKKINWNWNDWLTLIVDSVSFLVSLYALIQTDKQINQTKELNDKQIAIDAVDKTKNEVYLKAVSRVNAVIANIGIDKDEVGDKKTIKKKLEDRLELFYRGTSNEKNLALLRLDIELILGVYDYINLLYFNKLADQDIIRRGIYRNVRQLHKAEKKCYPCTLKWTIEASRNY